jgi:glycosyltransferase involved in cell wall biosynthesis
MKASILFITYLHENYVAEAIRSAMSQDYQNLEIVVCDDFSNDNTLKILENELLNCPKHIQIVRAHSTVNSGLINVFNRCMDLCSGEVIIAMSGDDVSLPTRVTKTVGIFTAHANCTVVCTNWKTINESGLEIQGKSCQKKASGIFRFDKKIKHIYGFAPICGAAMAYRATLRDTFGPMIVGHHAEDNCYLFRGLLMGEIHYLPEQLVHWRTHGHNQSNWSGGNCMVKYKSKYYKFLLKHQNFYRQWNHDIKVVRDLSHITNSRAGELFRFVLFDREWQRLRRYSISQAPLKLWFTAAKRAIKASPSFKVIKKTLLSQLKIRLSSARRDRFWADHLKN